MNSNITKNVADPLSNQDVVTKNYIHTYAFLLLVVLRQAMKY